MMDYMGGGELFRLLNEKQKFSLPLSRFYAAEVLMALDYIHSQGFVYRGEWKRARVRRQCTG